MSIDQNAAQPSVPSPARRGIDRVKPPPRPVLLIRADGGPGIGNGHVLRCLALAEAWLRRGGGAMLAAARLSSDLRDRTEAAGVAIQPVRGPVDADELRSLVTSLAPSWVVVDGYAFDAGYQAATGSTSRVLVVDDHGSLGRYHSDIVLDQNLGADAAAYHDRPAATRLLLGPRYALVGEAFRAAAQAGIRKRLGSVQRLLVTLGGAPSPEVVAKVQAGVDMAGASGLTTFAGGDRPVRDMAAVMATADVALSAAGSTVWELSALGVPMLLFPVAENQERVAMQMAAAGAAIALPPDAPVDEIARQLRRLLDDSLLRSDLARSAGSLVDGNGARRVVTALKASLLELRDAGPGDAALLWRWANDPAVRRSAFDQAEIPWPAHEAWLAERLRSANCRIHIAHVDGEDIGQIRFERNRESGEADVDVSVAIERRGEGWAPALIERASEEVLGSDWAKVVHAWVKPDNLGSQRAFLEAGFSFVDQRPRRGHKALHYARRPAP